MYLLDHIRIIDLNAFTDEFAGCFSIIHMSLKSDRFFFFQYAGDLCIIVLSRGNGENVFTTQ
jgi:hypothetical protein